MYNAIFGFGIIYGLAKLVDKRSIPFYVAGVLFAVLWYLWQRSVQLLMGDISTLLTLDAGVALAVDAFIASALFWLLDRLEDTIVAWMVTFLVGWYVLVML